MAQQPPQPVYYPVYYPAPAEKKNNTCLTCLLIFLVVCVVGCVVLAGAGVAGYFMIKNSTINTRQILALVGKAPGEVNFVNLGDEQLTVTLTPLDDSNNGLATLDNERQLEPMDIDGFTMNPGRYRLDFSFPSGEPAACSLLIAGNDYYQFIATDEGIVVAKDKNSAGSSQDPRIGNSPLCQQ
jgi:hypothetical protein